MYLGIMFVGNGYSGGFADNMKMVIILDFGFADFHVGLCTTTVFFASVQCFFFFTATSYFLNKHNTNVLFWAGVSFLVVHVWLSRARFV